MTYRVPLPVGGRSASLDIVEPFSTMIQRQLRRSGLASYEPSTAATLLALFERAPAGFVFFDVGANIGLYATMCAAMFDPSAVHAFEPSPPTAEIAERIVRANDVDVRVVRAAASDHVGHAELFLSPVSDASHSLTEGFRDTTDSVRVPTLRLDDHVRSTGIRPDVIKIDVETHEAAVLAGAVDILERDRPTLIVEALTPRRGRDFGREIMEVMEGRGYRFHELVPDPSFDAVDSISGRAGVSRDWLLTPGPLPSDFEASWTRWSARLAECTPDRNSHVPVSGAIRAAWRRGGARDVASSIQRAVTRRLPAPGGR